MILVNFAPVKSRVASRRIASRRVVARCIAVHRSPRFASQRCRAYDFARPSPDIVSRNAMRFIVFDSLNAYNFGARLVGNIGSMKLSRMRAGIFRCTSSHARVLHTVAFSVPEVFIREAGWPELNREFMLSLVN